MLRNLKPGQPGTKRLLAQYGEQLICVRYRYDAERQTRRKTVELLVEEVPWEAPATQLRAEEIVGLRIGIHEVNLQRQIKLAGGKWNPTQRVWELRYDQAVRLQLTDRMEPPNVSHIRKSKVSGMRK